MVGVLVGTDVELGGNCKVALGTGEFLTSKVAVTTITTGEEQLHWFAGSGVSVDVAVIVAVRVGVGVMLGV